MRAADGGYAPRFLSFCLALSFFRFDSESTLPPTAANASRWVASLRIMKKIALFGIVLLFASCTSIPTAVSPTPVFTDAYLSTATLDPTSTITATTQSSNSNESKNYVGLKYPPLPQELSEEFAVVISVSHGHLLSLVEEKGKKMLWLSKMTHRDSAGKAYWIVKGTLIAPDLNEDEMFYANGCLLNEVFDYDIIAAGKWDEDVQAFRYVPNNKIFQAWRVNFVTGSFEEIATDGVECVAEFQFR
jgi:hypothetical protein